MGLGEVKGYNGTNVFETTTAQNDTKPRRVQTLAPPDKGYTRIRVEVHSAAQKGRDGKVVLSDEDVERALFDKFGLHTDTQADLQKLKDRLGTTDNPFDFVITEKTEGADYRIEYRTDGKYRIALDVKNPLYTKLSGKAAQIRQQIKNEKQAQSGDAAASKKVFDAEQYNRAKLGKLMLNANVLPSSFGIPSKLTDKTHVVLTLPEGAAPSDDSALTAYIEKRFGGGNLFGDDKRDILNAAKQSGVKVENLKVSPNNRRVVEFDLDLESMLKLQKSYLDVQAKANNAIDAADKIKEQMALNQFLLGVVEGAIEDVKGNINAIAHPIETLQGIRDALGILSKLTAEDLKNIAAEIGTKAAGATSGEAAHAAGYVIGTVIVEALLAKGAGAAFSALGKTKAGAEFLARVGKLKELVSLGKAKVAEAFTDEAALAVATRLRQRLQAATMYAGIPADALADLAVVAANKVKNGAVRFGEFSKQMVQEFGEKVEPYLSKLYRDGLISLDLNQGKQILSAGGKVIDEAVVREAKEKVFDLVKNNKPVELQEFFEGTNGIRNKYGSEFVDELKQTRDKFVDNLSGTTRRTVDTHDLLGGHIREEHIGRSETWLRNRLETDLTLRDASSFPNEAIANRALGKFVNQYEKNIKAFLSNSVKNRLEVVFDFGEAAGKGVTRGKSGQWTSNRVYVMLVKDNSSKGWHTVTAYPTLLKEVIK